jgi:hypothetical protein
MFDRVSLANGIVNCSINRRLDLLLAVLTHQPDTG